jgi:hypothetical protein
VVKFKATEEVEPVAIRLDGLLAFNPTLSERKIAIFALGRIAAKEPAPLPVQT